jgi:RHS repeat-associated protein
MSDTGNHWVEIEVWGKANVAYVGDYFEWTGSTNTMTKYYYAGGQRVAVRRGSTLSLLQGDHLGSTAYTADPVLGRRWTSLRYKAWGEQRYAEGVAPTDFRYTGQRFESLLGLHDYGARWYDSYLNRWIQPDSIVPDPHNPADWDRYSYVRNNPLKYIDKDGHIPILALIAIAGAFLYFSQIPSDQVQTNPDNWGDPAVQLIGATLMVAPAIASGLCLNDGDCANEANAVAQASQNASQAVQGAQNTAQIAQSVWQMNPLDRGVAIENMLGRTPQLTQNFPVIDRFQNGIAASIKSIDLMARSYQNISQLTRTVQGYVNTLANWQGARWGGVTIQANQITGRELILAIPPNASQAQLQALQQLQQWALNQGVTLTLTTVK